MAYTLKYTPPEYSSAHGDVVFTVFDDTKPFDSVTYPDYKYVCDVRLAGIIQARLKSYPRPEDKIGVFNIGSIIRNYFKTTFVPTPNVIRSAYMNLDWFFLIFGCSFGEDYNFVTYPNIINDSERYYFNHYNSRLYGAPTILTSVLDKVMSSRPYATNIDINAKLCNIPFLATDDSQIQIQIRCYNKSLGLIRQVNHDVNPNTGITNEVEQINVAPQNLNAITSGTIDSIVDYYTVTFSTPNIIDDSVYRFDLTCESKYEVKTIHFLNKYGGFESKEFVKLSRKTIDSNKSTYRKPAYIISNNGANVDYYNSVTGVYNEQSSVYSVDWKENMVLNTDILNDNEYVWLKELILSPMVFIEDKGFIYPVIITDNNYEERKVINDKLTNLTLNVEFADTFNSQYR